MDHPEIAGLIAAVADFPKPGIVFRDITPLLGDVDGFRRTIDLMAAEVSGADAVAATESRGFVFGAPVAYAARTGLILVRKAGKLPGTTAGRDYQLEYGTDRLEISTESVPAGSRVVVIDDVIATGGTAVATVELLRSQGAIVERALFVIDLVDLGGSQALEAIGCETTALVRYADT